VRVKRVPKNHAELRGELGWRKREVDDHRTPSDCGENRTIAWEKKIVKRNER